MDTLFKSIDVRDLLSAHDLSDPTAPLSAPDLRLLINRLESHSLQIRTKIQSYLVSHHQDFYNLFSLCNDAVSRSHQISDDVSSILAMISGQPVEAEIREIFEEIKEKTREAKVKSELLDLVKVIVGISERLKVVRDGLRNGRLRFSAEEIRELKKALNVGGDNNGDDQSEPEVYRLLRKEWSECFEEIQEVLVKFMENAVRFEPEANIVQVKYQLDVDGADRVKLRTVLEAMEVVGILDYGLAKVVDLMVKFIISPVVTSRSRFSFVRELKEDSDGKSIASLRMVPSLEKIENMNGENIYSGIIQVIKFIYECICGQNSSWIRCFGRLLWPRISELIISNFLSKVIPKDASKLADFRKIIECTSEFEASLKETMFISTSDDMDERLSRYAENVEVHFASRKKIEILAKARKLLLQCDFAVPQELKMKGSMLKNEAVDTYSSKQIVELLFLSERCVVSEAATQLMELVHQTLQDVCLSSTRVALEFYNAARDAILLYEVVIPVKLGRQLDGINQVAVLMHNDCLYLSQEILGLAFEYCSDFPSLIKEHAVFIDMAPRFHLMAEEILQRQIQVVIYNLKEAIDGADGFQNTHEIQKFESAKFSIDQVVFILEKVHIIWEPLLMPSKYKRGMCAVLDSVLSRITRDTLLLDDMAAEETLQLQRLIHLMLENLSSLLDSLTSVQPEKSQEDSALSLEELIPSLSKIRKLAGLLDMPLRSITTEWESGLLLRCGFTLPEIEDFIKAIFADSPLRKECLWRLENATF